MPLPSDDEEDTNKMLSDSRSPSNESNNDDLGLLLYELASLNVTNNELSPSEAPQTCPICSVRVSLQAFPDHVHSCLDKMDDGDRNDLRSQQEKDSDFAIQYALRHGYVTDYTVQCPSCGEQLLVGTGMNEHVNLCMDGMAKREEMKQNNNLSEDEDDDIVDAQNQKKVEVLSREQMIECSKKLMTLQQGTEAFDNMLDMFGALGFNKKNISKVLEIEKQQSNKNMIQNNHNKNNNDHNMEQEDDKLSTIREEEDDDLFNEKSRETQYIFDDDD